MADIKTMPMRMAEHLHTDEGYRSREQAMIDGGTDGLLPGTILGAITATGVHTQHDPAAVDGTQNVSGVLFEAAVGDVRRTIHVRACEMVKAHLTYSAGADAATIIATDAQLRALGIIPRA